MADVLAVGAHPDDVELGCGGLVALLTRQGRKVVIADMTRGEMGSRGSVEERAKEAAAAASVLGADERRNLMLPDTQLSLSSEAVDVVIRLIREVRPRIVVGPYFSDRHPDHAVTGEIVKRACYLAGLQKRSPGLAPHRPSLLLHYFSHETLAPTLIVDISGVFEIKETAIRSHASQLNDPLRDEPQTILSHPQFLERRRTRDRYFGSLVGCAYGEPYFQCQPPRVGDVFSLIPPE